MIKKGPLRAFVPYIWWFVLLFYVLPLPSLLDTRAANETLLMSALFIIDPMVLFLGTFMFARKEGFFWWPPLIIGALFFSTIFIYYNHTALFYVLFYIFLTYIGGWCGSSTRNRSFH